MEGLVIGFLVLLVGPSIWVGNYVGSHKWFLLGNEVGCFDISLNSRFKLFKAE